MLLFISQQGWYNNYEPQVVDRNREGEEEREYEIVANFYNAGELI